MFHNNAKKRNTTLCRRIGAVCLIIVMAFCLAGCFGNEEDGPTAITEQYFDAVKAGDVNGAIACFTPAIQQQYSSMLSLGGMFGKELTGIDASSVLGGLMSMANLDAYQDCEFIVDNVEFTDSEHEHADVHVTVEGASGNIPSSTSVKTVLYQDEWYIEQ